MIQNNRFQQATVLNASNSVVGRVMQAVSYVSEYINLKSNNEQLAKENARLYSMLKESSYNLSYTINSVNDTVYLQEYRYINAKVVNNSVNRRNNYLTLDKGSLHGIVPEMGVICSEGIVGIIKQVSPHFCTVMSVLHKDARISAKFRKNEFFGSLVWDGEDPAYGTLKEIDKTVPVHVGDTIVTTAFSSIYPSGIMVGTVAAAEVESGTNFHHITVKLSTPFRKLSSVYIIDHLLKNEQRNLEEITTQNDH